jgi:quinol monooxygenase YgiN
LGWRTALTGPRRSLAFAVIDLLTFTPKWSGEGARANLEVTMIGIVATIKVQEGKGADFEAVFLELTGKVRANESGNILYQLTKSRTEADTYKVIELYKDQEAVTAHGSSDHFKELGRKMGAFMAGRPVIEYLDAVE